MGGDGRAGGLGNERGRVRRASEAVAEGRGAAIAGAWRAVVQWQYRRGDPETIVPDPRPRSVGRGFQRGRGGGSGFGGIVEFPFSFG